MHLLHKTRQANYAESAMATSFALANNAAMAGKDYYLEEWRQSFGYSQEHVAGELTAMKDLPEFAGEPGLKTSGTSQSTVNRIEKQGIGRRYDITLRMLAKLYNTTVDGLTRPPGPGGKTTQAPAPTSFQGEQKRKSVTNLSRHYPSAQFSHIVPVVSFLGEGGFDEMVKSPDVGFTIGTDLPDYADIDLCGYELEDESMNEIYPKGSVVIFGDYEVLKPLQRDDKVVIRRAIPGGEWQTLVRQAVQASDGTIELWPRSTSSRWKAPLALGKADDDRQDFKVVGIVLDWRPARSQRSGISMGLGRQKGDV